MSDYPRTIVEFKDREGSESSPIHKVSRVHINGQEVLVERGSILLDFGENEATTVTLTLQPNEIRFNK